MYVNIRLAYFSSLSILFFTTLLYAIKCSKFGFLLGVAGRTTQLLSPMELLSVQPPLVASSGLSRLRIQAPIENLLDLFAHSLKVNEKKNSFFVAYFKTECSVNYGLEHKTLFI